MALVKVCYADVTAGGKALPSDNPTVFTGPQVSFIGDPPDISLFSTLFDVNIFIVPLSTNFSVNAPSRLITVSPFSEGYDTTFYFSLFGNAGEINFYSAYSVFNFGYANYVYNNSLGTYFFTQSGFPISIDPSQNVGQTTINSISLKANISCPSSVPSGGTVQALLTARVSLNWSPP